MISKKNFNSLMTAMQIQKEIDYKATEHLQQIFEDVSGGFYKNNTLYFAIEKYLINELKDDEEWIIYFIYDLNFGKNWNKNSCLINGYSIDLSTINKLYDFLIKNKKK